MLLENKICIVTGAGKGFGRDIARAYYAQGAKLALITRSQVDVDDLIAEFGENDKFFFFCGDVSDAGVVSQFVSQVVNKFGTIDVLVNNAGIRFRKGFLDISNDELDQVLDVNLKSVFTFCQAVLPHMIKNHEGKIPTKYLTKFLEHAKITEKKFHEVCDSFTNKELFLLNQNGTIFKDNKNNPILKNKIQ